MAEYWKSTPKYWCKQCKIYIRDTAFEKNQHEATAKHQSNLKRFLRDIHRDNERQQRDSQRAKDEVERLRQTVAGTPGGKGGDNPPWKSASSGPAAAAQSQARPVPLEERKKQMAQLAEMGIAIPEEYRAEMALAGEWQTVSEKVIQSDEKQPSTLGVRKRKHDAEDEEEEEAKREADRFVSKGWGSATRRYPGAQEDDEDLDALLASTKDVKKTKPSGTEQDMPAKEEPEGSDGATAKEGATSPVPASDQPPQIKKEVPSEDGSSQPGVKNVSEETTAGVVFKKRKPKAMRK